MHQIIITTDERFVFHASVSGRTFERLFEERETGEAFPGTYTLQNARNVINWRNQDNGRKGLPARAAYGPANTLLSPAVPRLIIPGSSIRQVYAVSADAAAEWDRC